MSRDENNKQNNVFVDAAAWLTHELELRERLAESAPDAISPTTKAAYKRVERYYLEHFEGLLPAKQQDIARYVIEISKIYSPNTVAFNLNALSYWHKNQGFKDPTRTRMIRDLKKHIDQTSNYLPRRSEALSFSDLKKMDESLLEVLAIDAFESELVASTKTLMILRDRALLLLGFWRACSAEELVALKIEDLNFVDNDGLNIETRDKYNAVSRGFIPKLRHHCPVSAIRSWIESANLRNGPLFRPIDKWGYIHPRHLNPRTVEQILKKIANDSGVQSHIRPSSLKRGYSDWTSLENFEKHTIAEYVGWIEPNRNVK